MVEQNVANVQVAGSNPVPRTSFRMLTANLYTELLIQLVKIHPVYYGVGSSMVEPWIVIPVVAGSSPVLHPNHGDIAQR